MKVKLAPFHSRVFLRNQDGQLTIFLAIGLTIFLTMTAFIINVGLFVKAKINLQNATDAAAWSGAAVQARQLSQIAYLNYEIRNVYKEWMFKYYVLGNLGHTKRMTSGGTFPYGDFRLRPAGGLSEDNNFDRYNVPSVCVHSGTGGNDICLSSFIPGLPRFETVDLPNITDESQQFIDKISSKKADDCAYRSSINFATTLIWTYGTGANITTSDLPALTSGRLGAWPAAFFLGARVRNLEAMVNRPPLDNLCAGAAAGACTDINSLELTHVANERPIKAFYAGFRNYSGGIFKESDGAMDETAASFRLEELEPRIVPGIEQDTLSGMLIPPSGPAWNPNPLNKRYLDLQAIPINYSIFYTSFSARTNDLVIDGTTLPTDAECTTTKTAMPVPAYLTGFQKNPAVLTYYAVRSRVKFSGLFFPFGSEPLEISTVSAAKPFGGRIGPKLFQVTGEKEIRARQDHKEAKSAPNLSALEVSAGGSVLDPGTPIPTGQNFWITDITSTIGGVPGTGVVPKYSIPNMIYGFSSPANAETEIQFGGSDPFETLRRYNSLNIAKNESFGLYNSFQFEQLRSNLSGVGGGGSISSAELLEAIDSVRQPTYYDTINYLIPTIEDDDGLNIKSTTDSSAPPSALPEIRIYAPLIDNAANNSLFPNAAALTDLVNSYISSNNQSVINFLAALKEVAEEIRASGTGQLYIKASDIIYPLSRGTAPGDAAGFSLEMAQSSVCVPSAGAPKGVSIAARFSAFLQQTSIICPNAKPLSVLMGDYIQQKLGTADMLFHIDSWYTGDPVHLDKKEDIMTAYRPGTQQGADAEGKITNPLSGNGVFNHRNYYSTKFMQFDIVSNNPRSALIGGNGASLMEENDSTIFVINTDVATQISGDYKNKLIETINVKW